MPSAVILAAGLGTRLTSAGPKPLARLATGETILGRQLRLLQAHVPREKTIIVVGYRREVVQAAAPGCRFAPNDQYAETNTARSLLAGLTAAGDDDTLFMNGDVVFDEEVICRLLDCETSAMAVDRKSCGDEEVKYRTAPPNHIVAVSKTVHDGEGEALGVNLLRLLDRQRLITALARCEANDYFERGIEMAIADGANFTAVDVGDIVCVEVDFPGDLQRANGLLLDKG